MQWRNLETEIQRGCTPCEDEGRDEDEECTSLHERAKMASNSIECVEKPGID
jgi:hypothetical protein